MGLRLAEHLASKPLIQFQPSQKNTHKDPEEGCLSILEYGEILQFTRHLGGLKKRFRL